MTQSHNAMGFMGVFLQFIQQEQRLQKALKWKAFSTFNNESTPLVVKLNIKH